MNTTTVIENVEFRATAPATRLPGLDAAQQKLTALSATLKQVQAQLAGMSSNAMFKLSARQFADRAYTQSGKLGTLSVRQLARRIGFPDSKDVAAVANQLENEVQTAIGKIQRRIDNGLGKRALANAQRTIKELQGQSFFTDASARQFRNPTAAGRFFERYSKLALANKERGESALRAILTGTVPAAAAGAATLAAAAGQVQGPKTGGQGQPSKVQGPRSKVQGAKPGVTTTRTFSDGAGGLIEEKTTTYPGTDTPDKVTQVRRTGAGKTVTTTIQGDNETRTLRDRAGARLERQFNQRLAQLAGEYGRGLPAVAGNAQGMAQLRRNVIGQAGALYRSNPQFAALGLNERMAEFVHGDLRDESASYRKAIDRQQKTLMKRREKAGKDADTAARRQAEAEIALLEDRKRAYDRFQKTGTDARAGIERARAKTAAFDAGRQQQNLFNTVMTQAAQRAESQLLQRGAKLRSYATDPLTGRRKGATYDLVENGYTHTYRVDYEKQAASVRQVSKQLKEAKNNSEMLGGDFVKNTLKVTAWSASVGVLYKTVELATHSFEQLTETGYTAARLDQVYRKVGGSTRELTGDLIQLAAANGRSTEEAMASGLQWARLGLNRMQINEAVKISLMAANDAGTTAEETTENLQAVMQTYGLRVGQLRTLLAELVYVTNNYNVTTQDMLTGLSRTAAAAKQAGLPLAELQGILAATIGNTGQSGANIGNAIKSVTLALSNPALQDKLRTEFRFETTQGGEDIKGMGQLLGDLYVRYMKLNDAQRQSLLFSVAGRTQANRLAAMMNSYVQAQTLAINAQLNLNNAEEENTKITSTLKAQLAGVADEWERLVVIQGNHGPVNVLGEILTAMRNVLTVMNAPGMKLLTTGMLGLGAVALGRAALATVSVRNAASAGFLGRSGAAILREAKGVSMAVDAAMLGTMMRRNPQAMQTRGLGGGQRTAGGALATGQFLSIGRLGLIDRAILKTNIWGTAMLRAGTAAGTTSRAAGLLFSTIGIGLRTVAAASLAFSEFLLPIAAIYGVMKLFNFSMEAYGQTIEKTEERMAGFNREAQKAHSAADAFAEAGRAMATFQSALTPDKMGMMRPDDVARLAGQIPDLTHLDEPDQARRKELQTAAREELNTMIRLNNVQGIRALLDKQQTEYARARVLALNQEYRITRQTVAALDEKILDLKQQDKRAWFGHEGRNKNIEQLQQEKQDAEGNGVKLLVEQTQELEDSWEQRLQYDDKHLAALEREKLAVQSIAEIYNQIQTSNPLEKAQVNIASLGAQKEAIERHMQALTEENQQDTAAQQAMAELKQRKAAELAAAHQAYAALTPDTSAMTAEQRTAYAATVFTGGRMQKQAAALDDLRRQQEAFDHLNPQEAGPGTLGMISRDQQRKADQDANRQKTAELEAQRRNLALSRKMTEYGYGEGRAEAGDTAAKYGVDETAKLLNERKHLLAEIGELQGKQNKTTEEYGRLLKDQQLAYANMLSLRTRHAELEAEIHQLAIDQNKEFGKSFFGSGPAEMLRKLAAMRLAMNGPLKQGQLYNLNPAMRQDVGQLTGQTPEMTALHNELTRLTQFIGRTVGGKDDKPGTDNWGDRFDALLTKFTGSFEKSLGGLDKDILKAFTDGMGDTLTTATKNLDKLGSAADRAAAALDRLAGGFTPGGGNFGGHGGGGGWTPGLAFASPGQVGGWYPGKQ